jgi:hypothetical protein
VRVGMGSWLVGPADQGGAAACSFATDAALPVLRRRAKGGRAAPSLTPLP